MHAYPLPHRQAADDREDDATEKGDDQAEDPKDEGPPLPAQPLNVRIGGDAVVNAFD